MNTWMILAIVFLVGVIGRIILTPKKSALRVFRIIGLEILYIPIFTIAVFLSLLFSNLVVLLANSAIDGGTTQYHSGGNGLAIFLIFLAVWIIGGAIILFIVNLSRMIVHKVIGEGSSYFFTNILYMSLFCFVIYSPITMNLYGKIMKFPLMEIIHFFPLWVYIIVAIVFIAGSLFVFEIFRLTVLNCKDYDI